MECNTEAAALLNGQLLLLAATTPVAKLYIVARGTGLPMVAAETIGRAGKAANAAVGKALRLLPDQH